MRRSLQLRRACYYLAACLVTVAKAWANPDLPTVVSGQASFQSNGKTLTVTNSPGAIINWRGFSIGADEWTRFLQESSLSRVLNRVTGGNPSEILGRLSSNGQVFLINPSGILFGANALVDVAGLTASSLGISDRNFLAGRMEFSGIGSEASVVNRGRISTPAGGGVHLIGPQVENSGVIRAPSGDIVLAAGASVRLFDAAFPSILVEVSAPGDRDMSLGNLGQAPGGRVFGFLVRQSGTVSATSAASTEAGRILLKSAGAVEVASGSITAANGSTGGSVAIAARDGARVAGAVTARGDSSGGGQVRVESARVEIAEPAIVDVTGAAGGSIQISANEHAAVSGALTASGESRSGGDILVTAPVVEVAAPARVDASGAAAGGEIRVVATGRLDFAGTALARAETSGSGGQVELSGHREVAISGAVDTRSANGEDGKLLIDPARITITAQSTGVPPALGDATWLAAENAGTAQTLGAIDLAGLLTTTSVTLQASEKIVVAEDAAVVVNATAPRTLTLEAPVIEVQGDIRSSGARLDVVLNAPAGGAASQVRIAESAELALAGGALRVAAQAVSVPIVEVALRTATPTRAVTPPTEIARLRAEVEAEIAREQERILSAQACRGPATVRQGCVVASPPLRRFTLGV